MDVSAPKARVNGAQLSQHVGRKVLLVCKAEGTVSGNTMTVLAADNQQVTVTLRPGSSYDSEFLEFEGIVSGPNSITEHACTMFGNSFGMC